MSGKSKFWITLGCFVIICLSPVFAGGTPEPPKILDKSGPQYFSPNNDGVKDDATIEFEVELYVKSNKDGYIPEATLQITDQAGGVVKEIKQTEKSDIGFGYLFHGFKKFTKMGWLTWDGKTKDGSLAPEGAYNFLLTVKDGSGKPIQVGLEKAFNLDLTKPSITKLIVDSPFSPNNDGNKDTLGVMQDGSEEALWVGTIENLAGVVLQEFTWKNSRPKDFEWDGREEDGSLYTNAVYQYRLSCTDLAGNSSSRLADGQIVLDNTETSISIALDYNYISPNGDGMQDDVSISLTTKVLKGLGGWSVTVTDVSGTVKRKYEETTDVPSKIVFDGKDDKGALLPDGEYRVIYNTRYAKGDNLKEQAVLTIDTKPPQIEIAVSDSAFSPNSDKSKDTTEVSMKSSEIVTLKGKVLDSKGQTIVERSSGEMTSSSFVLDGLDPSGNPVPEGKYLLSGTFTDRAGNSVNKQTEVTVDLTPPSILVTADPAYFSPEGDGIQDTTTVSFKASEPVSGQVEIVDPSGKTIYSGDIPQITSGEVVLDGLSSPMMLLGNGTYTIRGKFSDAAGNRVEPEPLLITRDDRPTTLRVAAVERIFSPDGDGVKDKLPIAIEASVRDGIKEWTVTINDANGKPAKVLSGSDRLPEVVEWDGSADGGKAAEGTYSARVKVEWRKGSIREEGTEPFALDVTVLKVIASASSKYFSPDGDGVKDKLPIAIEASVRDGIKEWTVTINDANGRPVKVLSGSDRLPEVVEWDGSADGGKAAEGTYSARVKVEWRKGSIQEGGTEPFTLDVTPPSVKVSTTASPFIKTDGEIEGEAFITLQVEDESGIENWSLDILTKTGGAVRSYAGDGDPSDLFTWKGETDAGRIIGGADVFLLKIDITDKSGNKRAFEQPLPIDVIVYRKDGKLHLIVPNIIFGAYKHTLDSAGKLWMNNNLESIKWVRDILSKYPNYGIELDAHALNIYRGNPAKETAEEKILGPLTERRAAEVKKTLIELGINEKRIKTEPYGGKFPIVSTKDREVYWKNRRVEFIITPP